MKQQLAVGIVAVALVGGASTGVAIHQVRSDDQSPRATPSPSASTTSPKPTKDPSTKAPSAGTTTSKAPATPTTPPLLPLASMRILAGQVGPVSVGVSKAAAAATGYFDTDVSVPTCNRVDALVWKSAYAGTLDVQTGLDGVVTSIGIRGAGPTTRSGLHIGSTYAAVRAVLGDGIAPQEAGYGQTGLFVQDGTGWIGFLFDATTDTVTDGTTVTFIEVTRGGKPGLMRDGC